MTKIKKVVDADALYFLDQKYDETIITPHWAEACQMTSTDKDSTISRQEMCLKLDSFSDFMVLKGPQSIVRGPQSEEYVNQTGNPVLACAGSGDVLTGVITSFLGQGLDIFQAASLAVYLHGKAADRINDKFGSVGATSLEITDEIRDLINS